VLSGGANGETATVLLDDENCKSVWINIESEAEDALIRSGEFLVYQPLDERLFGASPICQIVPINYEPQSLHNERDWEFRAELTRLMKKYDAMFIGETSVYLHTVFAINSTGDRYIAARESTLQV